jgi:outer membrane protein assembly factor BamB
MAHAESQTTVPAGPRRRIAVPLLVIALGIAAVVAVNTIPSERMDAGMRRLLSVIAVAAAAALVTAWFFFGAGLTRKVRLIGAALLVLLTMCVLTSVRRVEFSGDMMPTLDFRWTRDRAAMLEAHRARAAEASNAPRLVGEIAPGEHDVLEFRGARRDGVVETPPLARDWSTRPPKLVWRQPIGGGYASFVVCGPLAVTIEQRREREAIVAYDTASGREAWMHDYPALFSEKLGGDGPRATPTIHDGRVYSLGATGVLACLELATGKLEWSVNILEINTAGNTEWAMSGSPLIHDGLVIVNPGSQKGTDASHALLALEPSDGRIRFGGGHAQASYASPMLATFASVNQFLIFDAVGLAGLDAADGRELWRYPWKSDFDINASQPVLLDDERVLISSSTGSALLKIGRQDGAWTVDEVWKIRKMKCGYASPIAYEGCLYGIDESILACVELSSGKQKWKDRAGAYGHGQILRSGDLLIVLAESGELALVEATSERFHELGRIQAIDGKTWNNPTVVGHRIFVRNHLEMAAYDLPLAGEE